MISSHFLYISGKKIAGFHDSCPNTVNTTGAMHPLIEYNGQVAVKICRNFNKLVDPCQVCPL